MTEAELRELLQKEWNRRHLDRDIMLPTSSIDGMLGVVQKALDEYDSPLREENRKLKATISRLKASNAKLRLQLAPAAHGQAEPCP